MTDTTQIVPLARDRRGIRRFLDVPYLIYDGDRNWVAPLRLDLAKVFTKANPLLEHAEMALWVARRDGADVGRIMGLLDHAHNRAHEERTGFFGFFECINDAGVSRELFDAVRMWARGHGLNRLVGPTNPTTNDECGLLVNGFDSPPTFMMPYNPAYYAELVAGEGFRKLKDLLAFYLDIAGSPLDRLARIAARTRKRHPELTFRPVRRRTLDADLSKVKEVYNAAWEENWGFVPMTDAEVNFLAARLKPLLEEGLVWLVESPTEPVAFMLAMPDFNEALQPLRGRLLTPSLFKFLPYLFRWRSTRLCRVITLGIKTPYRGQGLEAVMLDEGFKVGLRLGFRGAEASWVLEDNTAMCRFMEIFDARPYKTYRLYEQAV